MERALNNGHSEHQDIFVQSYRLLQNDSPIRVSLFSYSILYQQTPTHSLWFLAEREFCITLCCILWFKCAQGSYEHKSLFLSQTPVGGTLCSGSERMSPRRAEGLNILELAQLWW